MLHLVHYFGDTPKLQLDRYYIYIHYIYISQFVPMKSIHWSMSLARAPVMSRMSPICTSGGYRPLGFLEHLGAEEVTRKSLRNVTIDCHRSPRSWFRLGESSNCNLSSHGWGKIHRNLIYLSPCQFPLQTCLPWGLYKMLWELDFVRKMYLRPLTFVDRPFYKLEDSINWLL